MKKPRRREPPGSDRESGGVRLLFGRGERRDDVGGGLLDAVQRRSQRVRLAVVELDVVAGGGAGVQAHGLGDDERHGLCLRLADGLAGRAVCLKRRP